LQFIESILALGLQLMLNSCQMIYTARNALAVHVLTLSICILPGQPVCAGKQTS